MKTVLTNPSINVASIKASLPEAWHGFASFHNRILADAARKARDVQKSRLGLHVVRGEGGPPTVPDRAGALADRIVDTLYGDTRPRAVPPEIAHLVEPVAMHIAVMSRPLFNLGITGTKTIPKGLLLNFRGPGASTSWAVTTEDAEAQRGAFISRVRARRLTEHGWDAHTTTVDLTSKDLEGKGKGIGWEPVVGVEDPMEYLASIYKVVQNKAQFERSQAASEQARLDALKDEAPYIATVFREETGEDRVDDTFAGRVLRALFKHYDLPLTVRVRRYSMASGMDLEATAQPTDYFEVEALVNRINAVLPGAARIGRSDNAGEGQRAWVHLQHGLYLREHEDRSDYQTDYHDPGGDRIAAAAVPMLRKLIRQAKARDEKRAAARAKDAPPSPDKVTVKDGDFYLAFEGDTRDMTVYQIQRSMGIPVLMARKFLSERSIGPVSSGRTPSGGTYYTPSFDSKTLPAPWATPAKMRGKYDDRLQDYVGGLGGIEVRRVLEHFGLWTPGANIFRRQVSAGTTATPLPLDTVPTRRNPSSNEDVREIARRVYAARRDPSLRDAETTRWELVIEKSTHGFKSKSGRDIPGFTDEEKAIARPLKRALKGYRGSTRPPKPPKPPGWRAERAERLREYRLYKELNYVYLHEAVDEIVSAAVEAGARIEHRSPSGTIYLQTPDGRRLRVSDHVVPETGERSFNVAQGGFSWRDAPHLSEYNADVRATQLVPYAKDGEHVRKSSLEEDLQQVREWATYEGGE